MAIVIKEVIVKTTVERKVPQWSQPTEEIVRKLKQEILAELTEYSQMQPTMRKDRKNR